MTTYNVSSPNASASDIQPFCEHMPNCLALTIAHHVCVVSVSDKGHPPKGRGLKSGSRPPLYQLSLGLVTYITLYLHVYPSSR